MSEQSATLVRPTPALEAAFRAMVADYAAAGEDRYQSIPELDRGDFAGYVRRLREESRGAGLPTGYVPQSTWWLVGDGGQVLGVSRLRHRLNDHLRVTGGHIGYDVPPSRRRRGCGRRLLALTLAEARARGIRRALLTCLDDNAASARIIEANGGALQDVIHSEEIGGPLRRYWIDLGETP